MRYVRCSRPVRLYRADSQMQPIGDVTDLFAHCGVYSTLR